MALSFALVNHCSVLNKLSRLKGLDASSNLHIVFITEPLLKDDTPKHVTSIAENQYFGGRGSELLGSGCLTYIKQDLLTAVPTDPILELIKEVALPTINALSCVNHMACIYDAQSHIKIPLHLSANVFVYPAFLSSASESIAGDLNLPELCLSTITAPPNQTSFASRLHLGSWVERVTSPTTNNVFDFVFKRSNHQPSVYV